MLLQLMKNFCKKRIINHVDANMIIFNINENFFSSIDFKPIRDSYFVSIDDNLASISTKNMALFIKAAATNPLFLDNSLVDMEVSELQSTFLLSDKAINTTLIELIEDMLCIENGIYLKNNGSDYYFIFNEEIEQDKHAELTSYFMNDYLRNNTVFLSNYFIISSQKIRQIYLNLKLNQLFSNQNITLDILYANNETLVFDINHDIFFKTIDSELMDYFYLNDADLVTIAMDKIENLIMLIKDQNPYDEQLDSKIPQTTLLDEDELNTLITLLNRCVPTNSFKWVLNKNTIYFNSGSNTSNAIMKFLDPQIFFSKKYLESQLLTKKQLITTFLKELELFGLEDNLYVCLNSRNPNIREIFSILESYFNDLQTSFVKINNAVSLFFNPYIPKNSTIPASIVYEISSYLEPKDLSSLSGVNKSFFKAVTNKFTQRNSDGPSANKKLCIGGMQ